MKGNEAKKTTVILCIATFILYLIDRLGILNVSIIINTQLLILFTAISFIIFANLFVYDKVKTITSTQRSTFSAIYILVVSLLGLSNFILRSFTFGLVSLFISVLMFSIYFALSNKNEASSMLANEKVTSKLGKTFWFIFLIALIIKIAIVLKYQGSYLDEYLHIFSALEKIDASYNSVYRDITYTRGPYLTLISGVILKLFGFNLLSQKLIPITVGSINMILFGVLSRKYIKNNIMFLLLMVAYTVSPLILFNHIYIRSYVFFELFGYLSIFLSRAIISSYENGKIKKLLTYSILLVLFIFYLLMTKDVESILFIIFPILIIGIYSLLNFKRRINLPFLNKVHVKFSHLVIIGAISLFACTLFVNYYKYIDIFFNGQLAHGGGSSNKYISYFLYDNLVITIVFINLLTYSLYLKSPRKKAIIMAIFVMFLLHQNISPDYRNLRGIFYFIPLLLLSTFIILESLNLKKAALSFMMIFFIAFSGLLSLPQFISQGPRIPGEIDYFPFKDYYIFVKDRCKDRKVISMMHSNYISNFYSFKPNYIIYLRLDQLENDVRYYKDQNGNYYQSVDDIVVITDKAKIKNIIANEKVCILVSDEFRHTGSYILGSDYTSLFENMSQRRVGSLKILAN